MDNKFETLDDYIKFYEKIPGDKWCAGYLNNGEGQSCALGHLQEVDNYRDGYDNELAHKLQRLIDSVDDGRTKNIVGINDNGVVFNPDTNCYNRRYLQEHPKDRVIAFLKDMREACFKQHKPEEHGA